MIPFDLHWLPENPGFGDALRSTAQERGSFDDMLSRFRTLATSRLDFVKTAKLDRAFQAVRSDFADADIRTPRIKIGILSSCTVDHLVPGIRVGGLRRGLVVDCYVAPYGQYHQEVLDPSSGLRRFAPDVVLLSLDSQAALSEIPLTAGAQEADAVVGERIDEIVHLWERIQNDIGAVVMHQAVLDRSAPLFGSFELRVPASPTRLIQQLNRLLSDRAGPAKALWLDLEWWARQIGTKHLSDPRLWHQAKQEI
jgi:predicted enzyme involved in methoxymalonyl-ACP biosynthesis